MTGVVGNIDRDAIKYESFARYVIEIEETLQIYPNHSSILKLRYCYNGFYIECRHAYCRSFTNMCRDLVSARKAFQEIEPSAMAEKTQMLS